VRQAKAWVGDILGIKIIAMNLVYIFADRGRIKRGLETPTCILLDQCNGWFQIFSPCIVPYSLWLLLDIDVTSTSPTKIWLTSVVVTCNLLPLVSWNGNSLNFCIDKLLYRHCIYSSSVIFSEICYGKW